MVVLYTVCNEQLWEENTLKHTQPVQTVIFPTLSYVKTGSLSSTKKFTQQVYSHDPLRHTFTLFVPVSETSL